MSDFATPRWPIGPVVSPWSIESGFRGLLTVNQGISATLSAVWPSASLALFYPIRAGEAFTLMKFYVLNGTAVAGNIDIGIYLPNGTRLLSTGAVAQAGVSDFQVVDVTDTVYPAGSYMLGLSLSDATTATVVRANTVAGVTTLMGGKQMAAAHPLPATAIFADATTSPIAPVFGFLTRTLL